DRCAPVFGATAANQRSGLLPRSRDNRAGKKRQSAVSERPASVVRLRRKGDSLMDALRQERKWNRIAAGEALGVPTYMQRVWAGSLMTLGSDLEVLALPIGDCAGALQVTDTSSPNFGANLFVLGISQLGGPDVMA